VTSKLENPRHEIFAQNIAKGMSATDAYREAGYTGDGVGKSGSRLLTKVEVKARVEFLRNKGSERAVIDIAYALTRMDELSRAAELEGEWIAAIGAHDKVCKITGAYDSKGKSGQGGSEALREKLNEMTYEQVMQLGTGNK
jgi:phage terminase small subunit